jgi:hypothetical protein
VLIIVAVYYSLLSGVSLTALAAAALVNNEVDRLILDTTFKVIRQYHTAILLAIIQMWDCRSASPSDRRNRLTYMITFIRLSAMNLGST